MAADIAGILSTDLSEQIKNSHILIIGAGGIGCEILKNCVLAGFPKINIIDLDTIELSNLNRQFLFQKEHVGRSKAEVARESALKFNPNVIINAECDNIITSPSYGISFYQQFNVVLNALDNREARNHVNRMCLLADIPLIESGTAGYNGQVELIKRGLTQCYECSPKAAQKSYPGCTIRNTPSEPIHCIVWGKHLFNQLFGEHNADEDVSPDSADPEAVADAANDALTGEANDKGNVERVSTRSWAQSCNYDAEKLFNKLFHDDIKYLLSMANLWKNRKSPQPLKWGELEEPGTSEIQNGTGLRDQQIWTLVECGKSFEDSVKSLRERFSELEKDDHLVWDKDDKDAMDFVASCANIRAHIFSIIKKSRFDIKSMAGNIIPAIATTNAITAGIVVNHAFKVLLGKFENCQSVYIRLRPNPRNQIFIPEKKLNPPNPNCAVCASCKPEVVLKIDTKGSSLKDLKEKVLIGNLKMSTPEVLLEGKGLIVISADDDDDEPSLNAKLQDRGIHDGGVIRVDELDQNYEIKVIIIHQDYSDEFGFKFEIKINEDLLELAKNKNKNEITSESEAADEPQQEITDIAKNGNDMHKDAAPNVEDDDDVCIVETDDRTPDLEIVETNDRLEHKRKFNEIDQPATSKKIKLSGDDDDDCMIVDEVVEID